MDEKVMVAGHICLDIAPRFPQTLKGQFTEILTPGKIISVDDAILCTGGAVSNTGLAMMKLGVNVLLNGKVGDDEFGSITKQLVGKEKAAAFKTVAGENSSYTVILALPGVDRIFLHSPGPNDTFAADDIDYKAAGNCELFHFGYPPLMKHMYKSDGAQLTEIFRRVKELNVTTSLDMALPDPSSEAGRANWQKILEKTLPYVDVFLPSIEEITFMLDRTLFDNRKAEAAGDDPVFAYKPRDCTDISSQLLAMGAKIVALKCGIRGYYLRTASAERFEQIGSACPNDINGWANRELWSESFKAEQFGSATGAGDATIAGFLCGLIRDFSPQDSLQIANTLGWQNVRAIDALSGIEDWQTTLDLLRDKSRARNLLQLNSDDWQYCNDHQVFYGPQDSGDK